MVLKTLENASHGKERARRRKQLMRQMGPDSIAIVPSSTAKVRNRDTEYAYRQDSDFFYLSGFEEPEALLVLVPGRDSGEYLMFCRERDAEKETWHGRRLGVERAPEILDADDAFPIGDIDEILPGLLEGCEQIYYSLGKDTDFDQQLMEWLNRVRAKTRVASEVPSSFVSLDFLLHEMRVFKTRSELSLMKRAARISAEGHARAMQQCKPGMMEYEIEAELIGTYKSQGATHAFLPIVGGGENGCILHYTENTEELKDGDLVLVDSGAEYASYAGDITRTFPVSGRFSDAQRDVYSLVLDANLAAIEAVKPGVHWNEPHEKAVSVLTRGLISLGLLKGTYAKEIRDEGYRRFYMTIEPGLYITSGRGIPRRYANIGIRIEDDVVVTRDGYEVLTSDVPKSIDEIEALMADG